MHAAASHATAAASTTRARSAVPVTPAMAMITAMPPATVMASSDGSARSAVATAANATHRAGGNEGKRQPRSANNKTAQSALASQGCTDDDGPPANGLIHG